MEAAGGFTGGALPDEIVERVAGGGIMGMREGLAQSRFACRAFEARGPRVRCSVSVQT